MPLDPVQVVRDVGTRLYELRLAAGLTQAELAEKLGCSEKYVRRLERGENLTLHKLTQMANFYEVSLESLIAKPKQRIVKTGRPPKP